MYSKKVTTTARDAQNKLTKAEIENGKKSKEWMTQFQESCASGGLGSQSLFVNNGQSAHVECCVLLVRE